MHLLASFAVWPLVIDFEKNPAASPNELTQNGNPTTVRVRVLPEDLSYDAIKSAIYEHAHDLAQAREQAQSREISQKTFAMRRLLLSRDIYEILNRRLVFKTAAHKDAVHFVTPYGNLRVEQMDEALDEPLSFIIE